MNSDDETWLDALAGRETPPSATAREASVLRAALRDGRQFTGAARPVMNVTALPNHAREDALIARAVSEGIIVTPAKTRRPKRWHLPLAASVLLVVTAGILVQLQPPAPIVRGDADGIVQLVADDPALLKQRILAELRAAGVSAAGYESLGVHGIDADLPMPLSPAVKRVLAAHGVAEPGDGVLRIEIRSSR